MQHSEAPKISIIVACRNEARHIRDFLDSLVAQDTGDLSWEAVIADGMSEDGTRQVLSEYCTKHPQIRFIDNPQFFVSTGLNAAIREAAGDVILRMDAHTWYAPDYVRLCVETLHSTGADNVGGPARTQAHGSRARAFAAAFHSRFSTGGAKFHDEHYEGWVDTVTYGCWRKATLERLGLFDEVLVRNQDDELNLRLLRRGGKIWQNPQIVSRYSPRSTLSSLFRQYFQYGFWKVAVIKKHHLPGSWRHLVPMAFVAGNILLALALAVLALLKSPQELPLIIAWLSLAACYVSLVCAASAITAGRSGWSTLPYLPLIFATYHVAYGLGFLTGLKWCLPEKKQSLRVHAAFTRLSR